MRSSTPAVAPRAARAVPLVPAGARRAALTLLAALLAACGGSDGATAPGGGSTPRSELPAGLAGSWRYGVISPSNFWNDHTGTFGGNAYGISDHYDFAQGGTFTRLTYIYVNSYGCQTQTWTEMQGTLTADAERFTLYPTQGRYKVADSCNASRNYTRAMTAAEVTERQGQAWVWARVERDGRTYLAADVPDGDEPAHYERQP